MTIHEVANDTEFASAVSSILAEPNPSGHEIILQDGVNFGQVLNGVQFADYVTVRSQTPNGAFLDAFMDDTHFVRLEGVRMLRINSDRAQRIIVDGCEIDANHSTHCVIFNEGNFIEIRNSTIERAKDDIMRLINCQDVIVDRNTLRDVAPTDPNAHPDGIQVGDFIAGAQRVERITITRNLIYDDISTGAERAQGIFVKIGGGEDIIIEQNLVKSGLSNGINLENTDAGDPFTGCRVMDNTVLGRNLVMEGVQHGTRTERNIAASVAFIGYSDPTGTSTNINNFAHNDTNLDQLFLNPNGIEAGKAGKNWEDYLPDTSGAIANIGAVAYLNELQTGGNPPMALVYSLETQAANGTAVVNPDGIWTYDPNLNFAGSDSFQYRVTDDVFNTFGVGTVSGSVVAPVPPSPDGSFTVDANTQASGDLKTL